MSTPMPDLREAFPKGCRVRVSPRGQREVSIRRDRVRGTVLGYSRDGQALLVLWEGRMALQSWHRDYVERVDA